jgi:hypothetical protein
VGLMGSTNAADLAPDQSVLASRQQSVAQVAGDRV